MLVRNPAQASDGVCI